MNCMKYLKAISGDLSLLNVQHSSKRSLNVYTLSKFRFCEKTRFNFRLCAPVFTSNTLIQKSFSIDAQPQLNPIWPDVEEFDKAYQDIVDIITVENSGLPPSLSNRATQVLNYNVQGGKKIRGLTVLLATRLLSDNLTAENIKLAALLGWCVELLQAFFLVSDDIMDNSSTRRGKPCWFRVEGIGLEAINDALFLQSCIYKVLELRFRDLECYSELISYFLEITRLTIYGQSLDMSLHPYKQPLQLEKFSMSHYKNVVELKTSHYSFCLPIHLAMHLVGNFSSSDFKVAQSICLKLGYLFQFQDDYLDVYGDSLTTGKIGSDIREGKCTWLAVTALENCSKEEISIMKKYYGVDDALAVEKILEFYKSQSVQEKYLVAEKKLHDEISHMISSLDKTKLKKYPFMILLKNLYGRKK